MMAETIALVRLDELVGKIDRLSNLMTIQFSLCTELFLDS